MNMRKQLVLALMLIISGALCAQNVKYVCSSKPIKESKLVSTKILGVIDENLYMATTSSYGRNLRLSMYQKESTTLLKTVPVKGFGAKTSNQILRDARYKAIIIKGENIYVAWEKENPVESVVFLQIFNKELQETQRPRSIYKLTNKNKAIHKAELFFLMSPNGSKMIVGGEESSLKNENVKLQYKVLNIDQEVINTIQAELPYALTQKGADATAEYQMDNSGNLYFNTGVLLSDEETNKRAPKERAYLFGNIDPESSEVKTKIIAFENKDISNFSYEIFDDHLFVFGTYSTKFNKKNRKADINCGIYTMKIDKTSFDNIGEIQFNELDETKVAYADHKMSSSKKKKYSKEEYAINQMTDYGLIITDFKKTEDDGLLLTLNSQVFRTVCSNKGGCSYYTDLYGVSFIKLNSSGEIDWISCTEQKRTYNGFIVPTNKIAKKGDKYFTVIQSKKKMNTSYLIDARTGVIKSMPMKSKYKFEESEVVGDELYFVGLKPKPSVVAYVGTGIALASIPISIVALPLELMGLGIGTGAIVAYLTSGRKRHDVYLGRYELLD